MQIYSDKKFQNPITIIEAFSYKEVQEAFKKIENYSKNYYLLGYIRYELKDIFLGKNLYSKFPLIYFEVFDKCENYIPKKTKRPIKIYKKPMICYKEYKKAIEKIKKHIAKGNTYEVNYTYPFEVTIDCDKEIELYEWLLQSQRTPYNTFLKNKYETLLSFSPELFFELKHNHIKTKPMKGTIARGFTEKEDKENIAFLQNDIKNKSENIMIVDLLRNDLSKIAQNVEVTRLFDIETHKTLHQMTSQVEADIFSNISLYQIFEAIFPCGSITGAPKISTMDIIEKTEISKREIYCGAIGFITPQCMTFSVPIRILQKKSNDKIFSYHTGGAIVWDSKAKDEWNETILKASFLQGNFEIIETILVENHKIFLKNEHLKRLKKTCEFFAFNFPEINFPVDKDGILRILINQNEYKIEYRPLVSPKTNKITISDAIINSSNPFIYHKTTYKPWYENSYCKIAQGKIFDEIFFNERTELSEGSRSNIIILKNGEYFTPPVFCGLLDGVYRQKLLREKKIKEKILYKKDLFEADKIFCINSVRKEVEVEL